MAEENGSKTNADQADLSLTALIKALDSATALPSAPKSDAPSAFDPNATMDYQQAGASYPELPFAQEKTEAPQAPQAQSRAPRTTRTQRGSAHNPLAVSGHTVATTSANPARSSLGAGASEARSSNYRPVNTDKTTYKIRGGGNEQRFKMRSPVFVVASALLVVIGIAIFALGLSNLSGSLSGGSTGGSTFDVTPAQTREALDSRLPALTSYVDASIEDTSAALTAAGQFLYTNGRYQPDSPDVSATGSELVSMPQQMTEEQMAGYYEGSYNAYSPEELMLYFNGTYVLDMARGDLGSWNKLKYVNFNATSIDDEMMRLAELQGLTGESVTISDQGVDSRGNKVIQGQKVIGGEEGERILYFKIAACPFNDIYSAQKVSSESVYLTCTLSTYDFFTGSDTITAE